MTEKPKAYSYLRISTDAQSIGDGIRRQIEASEKYASDHGYELVDTISDIGVSGYGGKNADKGAFGKFLTALEQGEVVSGSVLIVESLDRLSRSQVTRAFKQFTDILSHGVTIVTLIDDQIYTEDSLNSNFGQLFLSLGIMIRANDESETKSKRIKSVWAKKRALLTEQKMTKMTPAWLELDKNRLKFNVKAEADATIRKIFELCVQGMGVYSITRHLNSNLATYPPVSGAERWNDSYISKILRNPAVFGQFQPHERVDGKRRPIGEPIGNYFPIIVSEKIFYLAQSAMKDRRIRGAGRKGAKVSNLYSGLLVCGKCGDTVVMRSKGKPPRGYSYLRCRNSLLNNGCNCPAWRYSEFEEAFYSFVNDVSFSAIFSNAETQSKIDKLRNQVTVAFEKRAAAKSAYETLLSRFEDPLLPPELLAELRLRAEERRREIERYEGEIENLESEVSSVSFEEADRAQSDFISAYKKLEASEDQSNLKQVRFQMHGILKRAIERVEMHNFNKIFPWEATGNISPKLKQDLLNRGLKNSDEIEEFFAKPLGQRIFDRSERFFVVRFKNGVVRMVHPYESITYKSVSERVSNFAVDRKLDS